MRKVRRSDWPRLATPEGSILNVRPVEGVSKPPRPQGTLLIETVLAESAGPDLEQFITLLFVSASETSNVPINLRLGSSNHDPLPLTPAVSL